jgi:outer membrane protein insertion porin family
VLRYIDSSARLLTSIVALAAVVMTPSAASAQDQLQIAGGPIAIDSIAVVGNARQSDMAIILLSELTGDATYTIFDIRKAAKALWATGQFRDITAHVEGTVGDRVTLIWEVDERDILRNVVITGLENANPGEVRDTTGLRPGRPYSPAVVERAKVFIRQELAAKGIPFVNIEERIESIEGREKEIILYLDVTEGTRVTVADVVFEGNMVFSDEELRGAMSVQAEGFFWFNAGSYDRQRFDQDLQINLPSFYSGRGYLDFRVLGDSLVIDPTTGKTRIEIAVEEGPVYRLADFSISGSSEFSNQELERIFRPERSGLFSGDGNDGDALPIFNAAQFNAATAEAGQRYLNEGYLYSQVVPFVDKNPVEEGQPPTVNVGWSIVEGSQAYVARVDIEGNEYTYERVIRDKVFVLPGDVYSQDRLIQSFQSVSSLGYFEVPMEAPSITPNADGDVDLTFKVTEKPTGAVNFGTSVGGGVGGIAGFVGYDQPNLFGKGKSGSLRWDFGPYQNNQTISYTDPGIRGSLVTGSVNLFNARDRFISFRSGRRRRSGFNLRFGFLLPGARFTRFFTGYGLSRTALTLKSGEDISLFGRPAGTQSTISMGITRSTLNHPIFPTVGSRQRVNVELTGGPLGGDGQFVKTTAEGSWWLPVGSAGGNPDSPGSGVTFALGMTIRTGMLQGNSEPFPFDRFWMGGVQFGERLIGYDETTVTPLGYFKDRSRDINDINRLGEAFLSVSTEFAMRIGAQMSGAFFLDAGNVWRDAQEIDPTRMFRGAGLGIQLVTPFGPVGLDYAYGFDKTEPGWQFHFRLGPGL